MHLIRTLAPVNLPVSLAEAKAGARLDGDDEDALIAGYIRAATEQVDGPDGEIQRCLITQSWEMRLDEFPGSWRCRPYYRWPAGHCYLSRERDRELEIELPLPPLQSVESIAYLSGGLELTIDPSEYRVSGIGDRWRARIRPVTSWPTADDVTEAVTISFTCGYGDTWNDVPESIRHAIVAKVQGLYDGCASDLPEKLLRPYRVDVGFA